MGGNQGERVAAAAKLARLDVSAEERAELARDFERILDAFRALAAVDVSGVEPLFAPHALEDVMREDARAASLPRERALAPAPRSTGEFFAVPKALGGPA